MWKSAIVLYLSVVATCKWSLILFTNPNPVYSHTYYVTILYTSQLLHACYKLRPYYSFRCDQHLAKSKNYGAPGYVIFCIILLITSSHIQILFSVFCSKHLLRIQEIRDSNIGPMTALVMFAWFSKAFPGKCQDGGTN
jgi:hypothetical protein